MKGGQNGKQKNFRRDAGGVSWCRCALPVHVCQCREYAFFAEYRGSCRDVSAGCHIFGSGSAGSRCASVCRNLFLSVCGGCGDCAATPGTALHRTSTGAQRAAASATPPLVTGKRTSVFSVSGCVSAVLSYFCRIRKYLCVEQHK